MAAVKAEQQLEAKAKAARSTSASASTSGSTEAATYLDTSGASTPEAELPDIAKKARYEPHA